MTDELSLSCRIGDRVCGDLADGAAYEGTLRAWTGLIATVELDDGTLIYVGTV